jgi:hypothetical protein
MMSRVIFRFSHSPRLDRFLEFAAWPIERIKPGQVARHFVGCRFGLTELRTGKESALAIAKPAGNEFGLLWVWPPEIHSAKALCCL